MSEDNYKDHIYTLIVAGGGGTRLWPKSRNETPKQFLQLFEKQTLFQLTVKRLCKFLSWDKIFVVTVSEEYKKEILKEVPLFKKENVIVEPLRKNTAAAHGIGAAYIFHQDPNAVIINAAADHLVSPTERYERTMLTAAKVAFSTKNLVAVGIRPTYPNIGYGYIKRGNTALVEKSRKIYQVEQFTEKPELEVAKQYLASGNYYWNANQYVWRADTFLDSLEKHTPEVGKAIKDFIDNIGKDKEKENLLAIYNKLPEISVDYAVAEKEKKFLVMMADYTWTDIGDWNEVWENLQKDENGNVVIDGDEPGGRVINIDTSDAIIQTDGRLIAIIDVDNIAVIDSKDVLLICAKSRAQNVKKVVEQLKKEGKKEYL